MVTVSHLPTMVEPMKADTTAAYTTIEAKRQMVAEGWIGSLVARCRDRIVAFPIETLVDGA